MPANRAALSIAVALLPAPTLSQQPPPTLDMHLHGEAVGEWSGVAICTPFDRWQVWDPQDHPSWEAFFEERYLAGNGCPDPLRAATTDDELIRRTIEVMERRNVYGAVAATPDELQAWRAAAPERVIPALTFSAADDDRVSPDSLRRLYQSGRIAVLGEVYNYYDGVAPDDPRMEPYWALAEELGIPVGYHLAVGSPGEPHAGNGARGRLVSPLTLEEVLVRHPRLRLYIMHAAYPLLEDLLVLLHAHPQVYVDISDIATTEPRAAFYRFLERIVEAGFGNRVMFGSDQMVWPEVIERAIASIEDAPFLNEEQTRDILYHNAARFLRLTDEEIARHHGRPENDADAK